MSKVTLPRAGTDVLEGRFLSLPWIQWFEHLLRNVRFIEEPTEVFDDDFTAQEWRMNLYDPTTGALAAELPRIKQSGQEVSFKNSGTSANNLVISPVGTGVTVEGAATLTRSGSRLYTRLVADGSLKDWRLAQ